MGAMLSVVYALACYALFLGTFLYSIGFVGDFIVPKAVDTGPVGPLREALIVDTLLLGVFAVQHSVMARQGFKRWWTRIVPPPVERSTYVLAASLALALLFWQWRPLTGVVWKVAAAPVVLVVHSMFWLGWGIALLSTFLISHFELFGLSQVFVPASRRALPAPQFTTPLLYRHVRHPLYVGLLLAFWAAPTMSAGHLMFAVASTGYVLIGVFFEERDLIDQFGDRYRTYREQVGMLIPRVRSFTRAARDDEVTREMP